MTSPPGAVDPSPSRAYRAFGVLFSITCPDETTLARAERDLPPGSVAVEGGEAGARFAIVPREGGFELRRDGEPLGIAAGLAAALDGLEGEVRLHVAAEAPAHVFIHAGVVEVDGGAILLPGRTMTGKSTLVAALLRAGARYLSDEYAVLDDAGRVLGYPRPLRLRDGGAGPGRPVAASALGAALAGDGPWPASLVLATARVAGARFEATPLSAGEASLALLDNAVAARTAQARVLRAIRGAAVSARGYRVTRGEADEAARAILTLARGAI